jgi:hypothetical protein
MSGAIDWDQLDADITKAFAGKRGRDKRYRDGLREQGIKRERKPHESGAAWRKRHGVKQTKAEKGDKPKRDGLFIGVDGEGGGTDREGRQIYKLFRAGERELYRRGARLTTYDLCEFICSLPTKHIYVGFGFDYDATQILRDLSTDQLAKLFKSQKQRELDDERYQYVFIGNGFAVDYRSKQYFRVARVADLPWNGGTKPHIVPGSSRTIYETFGFFQCSFVKALERFDIGTPAERRAIQLDKSKRDGFDKMTRQIRDYNRRECELLSELMSQFRKVCYAGGIVPITWNGAGKLASALHKKHGTIKASEIGLIVPGDVLAFANRAYYGGRFEITMAGRVKGPIHEYDIRSAYPAAMLSLPCLVHGTWQDMDVASDGKSEAVLYVAECAFNHKSKSALCGLPIRSKQKRLSWPRQGNGVYWSVEIEAAKRLGATVMVGKGWRYVKQCECKPFDWLPELYAYRQAVGSGAVGIPIKLAINSLYGKLAQQIGEPPYKNPIWAGLITAITRAKLIDACLSAIPGSSPGSASASLPSLSSVIYLATDAVYSTSELRVPIGEGLGEWEHKAHPVDMFVVQPGLYWGMGCRCPACRADMRQKTRGTPDRVLVPAIPAFEDAWKAYREEATAATRAAMPKPPRVQLAIRNFTGLRLAHARGKPQTAGIWSDVPRVIDFTWEAKRADRKWQGEAYLTKPHAGSSSLFSVEYAPDDKAEGFSSLAAELTETFSGLADFADFNAPAFRVR